VVALATPHAPDALGAVSRLFLLPTGDTLTPDAAPGSKLLELDPHLAGHAGLRVGFATTSVLSPDGSTLLVLTAGYNRLEDERGYVLPPPPSEYVFVYDVRGGAPRETQVVTLRNAFWGLAFAPDGKRFYASGGPDDVIAPFERGDGGLWTAAAPWKLGHRSGLGLGQGAYVAGLAVSEDGATVVAANHENDSITVVDAASGAVRAEIDLRPASGPGGAFPAAVLVREGLAYVTCQRDAELVEVDLETKKVLRRATVGRQPTKLVASRDATRLYVANAGSDTITVVDRATLAPARELRVGARGAALRGLGANPNGLALSEDERTLYVSLGGVNAVALVDLATPDGYVRGWVPTGFYPGDVSLAGGWVYVPYAKSDAGPNPYGPRSDKAKSEKPAFAIGNQFSLQLMHGGVHAFPVPRDEVLEPLTRQALSNVHLDALPRVPAIFDELRGKVKHVVLVIAENRTYDQVLGDVPGADGDPSLVHWGAELTPNQHALATRFVTSDRFFTSGGVSGDGWQWTTFGRTTDPAEKEIPLMYAERGKHAYDWEGANRGINVGLRTLDARLAWNPKTPRDKRLMPGVRDVAGPPPRSPDGGGYLWDAVKDAKLPVRNYGCFAEDVRYGLPAKDPDRVPTLREPFLTKTRIAFPTVLQDETDPYYRGFDMRFPDYWRVREYLREYDVLEKKGALPALATVRLPHDHLGSFATAEDGVNTPDTQMADHDYAIGLLVERLSRSAAWEDTVVIVVEDDAQNGADHVDAHRSIVLLAGGHVARGVITHARVTTPGVLRTVELLLGVGALGRNDAVAPPLTDAFTTEVDRTPFVAAVPQVLRTTKLPLPPPGPGEHARAPRGTASEWELRTAGMDFSSEDKLPAAAFNEALWCGLKADVGCVSREVVASADDDDD
jgi:YVTN family beta-propeller protein